MKRRSIKDTKKNREILEGLGLGFTEHKDKKKIFIKVSNSDLSVIKELLEEILWTLNTHYQVAEQLFQVL